MPRYCVDKAEGRYIGYSGQQTDEILDERIDSLIAACERDSAPAFDTKYFPWMRRTA
ncbi:MAG: hypothetical protein ACLRX5_02115 [Slackia sp.]